MESGSYGPDSTIDGEIGSGGGGGGIGGWGTMGGSVGDGFLNNNLPYNSQPALQQQQQPQAMSSSGYGFMQQNHVQVNSPQPSSSAAQGTLSGSITRFATPDMHLPHQQQQQQQHGPSINSSSYAARSQQAYSSQANPSVPSTMYQVPNVGAQQQSVPTGSYAARSQMAYSTGNNMIVNKPGMVIAPTSNVDISSYSSRSQQQQDANQQQQFQSHGASNTSITYNQQQPPQTFSSNNQYNTNNQLQATSTAVGRQQQPSLTTIPQQQAQLSYAARSAQALYGTPKQQQQQQQQQAQQQQQLYDNNFNSMNHMVQQPVQYGEQQLNRNATTTATYGLTGRAGGYLENPDAAAIQQRILTDATKKIQEHAYYMKQAMEQKNLPVVLDRASHMVGELGGPLHGQQNYQQLPHQQTSPTNSQHSNNQNANNNNAMGPMNTGESSKLTPKNYYELYMRALEEMPMFEEYLLNLASSSSSIASMTPVPEGIIRIVDTSVAAAFANSSSRSYTMKELYECVQYCPRVVSRLYLQIAAGSALIRSGEVGSRTVLRDLQDAVKCEQNPIRGLFLRHYLLTALKDKLPSAPIQTTVEPSQQQSSLSEESAATNPATAASEGGDVDTTNIQGVEASSIIASTAIDKNVGTSNTTEVYSDDDERNPGNVKDSYEFVLANFMEMNKLWVRIQHLPGDGKTKEVRKRRGRERNDLRILVGTNLVRLSQMEAVTSKIYGEVILPQILEHIVIAGDPLSQAYIMDCLVQVFPDEYHIETLPILLNVCPRLRDKVNIRTILQGLMDRLANYLADEELLDESDTNEVKKTLARDSFGMFKDCVESVYNARGPKLTSREVIRLQTALLQFSIKCYPGNTEQVSSCISSCASALRQANASYEFNEATIVDIPHEKFNIKGLDDVAVVELEKLLSIPLDSLALKVLQFNDYSNLLAFLPWANRREVAMKMLKSAVESYSTATTATARASTSESPSVSVAPSLSTVQDVEVLFRVIDPLIRDDPTIAVSSYNNNNLHHITGAMGAMNVMGGGAGQQQQFYQSTMGPSVVGGSIVAVQQYTPEQLHRIRQENALVSKLVHLLSTCSSTTVGYEMLVTAKQHILHLHNSGAGSIVVPHRHRSIQTLVSLVFAALRLCRRVFVRDTSSKLKERQPQDDPSGDAAVVVESSNNATSTAIDALETRKAPDCTSVSELIPYNQDGENIVDTAKEVDIDVNEVPVVETTCDADATLSSVPKLDPSQPPLFDDVNESTECPASSEESNKPIPIEGEAAETISCRAIFVYIQETLTELVKHEPETSVKLYLDVALTADSFASSKDVYSSATDHTVIAFEFLSQAFTAYEEQIFNPNVQQRCLLSMSGTLLALKAISREHYEHFITKTAHYSAKITKKQDQFQLISLCAHLFYPVGSTRGVDAEMMYRNPQRSLECLQRCLKLADACTTNNPAYVKLFVDTLENYVFFFEKHNPSVTATYISGLVALIREHLDGLGASAALTEAKSHFEEILSYILRKKTDPDSSHLFASVVIG